MRTILKLSLYLGILLGGAFLAVNNIPSLRANIIEVVNPRVKEARILDQVGEHLDALDAAISPGNAGTISAAQIKSARKALDEAAALIAEVTELNDQHDDLTQGVVSKVLDAILPPPAPVSSSPSPQSIPSSSPSLTTPPPCVP